MNPRYISEEIFFEKKWIGVDFDDTIAKKMWPEKGIGDPMPGVKEALDKLVADGWIIVIDSARPWSDYAPIKNWLDDHKIPYRHIVLGKRLYKMYIGDEGFRFNGDWNKDMPEIERLLGQDNGQ